jgi:hypothetical protein
LRTVEGGLRSCVLLTGELAGEARWEPAGALVGSAVGADGDGRASVVSATGTLEAIGAVGARLGAGGDDDSLSVATAAPRTTAMTAAVTPTARLDLRTVVRTGVTTDMLAADAPLADTGSTRGDPSAGTSPSICRTRSDRARILTPIKASTHSATSRGVAG